MPIYTEIEIDGQAFIRRDNDDESTTFIRVDNFNSDYQEYLEHLTEKVADSTEE